MAKGKRIYQLPRLVTPAVELVGARFEVDVPVGPMVGGYTSKQVTDAELRGYLIQAATNAVPSLRKSVEFRTRAERSTFGPSHALSTTMEELLPLSMALGTTIYVTNDPDGVHEYRVAYDGAQLPAMLVWVDGDFSASRLGKIGGKIVPVVGAGGAVAVSPITYPVSLANGKTMGTFKDGDIIQAGTPYDHAFFYKALVEDILPTYATASLALTQSPPTDGEVGETVADTLTATFNQADAGALTSIQINRDGVRVSTASTTSPFTRNSNAVRVLCSIAYQAFVSYAAGAAKPVPPSNALDTRPAAVRNPSVPQAAEVNLGSNVLYLNGYYRLFFGAASTSPADSAAVRALPQNQLTNQGNQGTLSTGTTASTFAIALPPGYKLLSVFDLDNQGANITAAYKAQDTLRVNDAGGTPHDYFLYLYRAAGPYPTSARHQFTYGQ